jgi:hypothetical protein
MEGIVWHIKNRAMLRRDFLQIKPA